MERNVSLCDLPTEVLEKIITYLATRDILNLREAHPRLRDLTESQHAVSQLHVQDDYDIPIEELFAYASSEPVCYNITVLNFTSVYWVPADDMRRVIAKMVNLRRLYLMDTKMSVSRRDCNVYKGLPKLEDLALTILRLNPAQELPRVQRLYLHLHPYVSRNVVSWLYLLGSRRSMKELWVVEVGMPAELNMLTVDLPHFVENFTTSGVNVLYSPFANQPYIMRKLFWSSGFVLQGVFQVLPRSLQLLSDRVYVDPNWNYLLKFAKHLSPISPRQYRELAFNESPLDTIRFSEFAIAHHRVLGCVKSNITYLANLLLYPNMKYIKKLAINYCCCSNVLVADGLIRELVESPYNPIKDLPHDVPIMVAVLDHCPMLEELEIWDCSRSRITLTTNNNVSDMPLQSISRLSNLKRLVLDNIPTHFAGLQFLHVILENCPNLEVLCLKLLQENIPFFNSMCKALAQCKTLKDFRFEQTYGNVPLDRLFSALAESECLKLRRFYVKCSDVDVFSERPMDNFLTANPQLLFFYVCIRKWPQKAINKVKKGMEKFKDEPRKIYMAVRNDESYQSTINVPHVHVEQMIKCISTVSKIDIFKDFIR